MLQVWESVFNSTSNFYKDNSAPTGLSLAGSPCYALTYIVWVFQWLVRK